MVPWLTFTAGKQQTKNCHQLNCLTSIASGGLYVFREVILDLHYVRCASLQRKVNNTSFTESKGNTLMSL